MKEIWKKALCVLAGCLIATSLILNGIVFVWLIRGKY
jgi:hypothetical protein